MTDEERQRQMDFILQSQARSETRIDRLERVVKLMVRAGLRARRDMREQDARISTLVDSQLHTEEIARLNNEAVSELAEATRQNSDAIGELAGIVRELAGRQNGNGSRDKA